MSDQELPLSMLRSALSVLGEAAKSAADDGHLDPFHTAEVPLAVEDAQTALRSLEAAIARKDPHAR
ncbi:MAG: hypothetical protein AAGJ32_12775 [Pseudomonadota bacterium]